MKNVSSLKSSGQSESPKTPGGISKSLLTPCRRVGLSRNWKKKGPSPFISPLTSKTTEVEVKVEKRPTRKRKSVIEPDEKCKENSDIEDDISAPDSEAIATTPLRNIALPLKKKSKTFLSTLQSQESSNGEQLTASINIDDCTNETATLEVENDISLANSIPETVNQADKEVSPSPDEKKVIRKSKFKTPCKSSNEIILDSTADTAPATKNDEAEKVAKPKKKKSELKPPKTKSPNDLTKECIVVIQKKLLKVKEKYNKSEDKAPTVVDNPKEPSQPLFDSDSEDVPLSSLNKKEIVPVISLTDDDDFIASTTTAKPVKVDSKKDTNTKTAAKSKKRQTPKTMPEPKPPSQGSFDDDEDDFFDKKKTILIRKTYDKVLKPQKAKSTGSVTQKDIDDLKARIEVKKKMLLARAMTDETEELRTLIKKWQKGCQEALMELMDLMKIKCPDKHNMDYSEILQMLKIPPELVGYDSDHDCFNTPDDSCAVLSKFNDF